MEVSDLRVVEVDDLGVGHGHGGPGGAGEARRQEEVRNRGTG